MLQEHTKPNPLDWQVIHRSPSPIPGDDRHMIETWENNKTGTRYFIPYHSRTGRSWAPYRQGKGRLSFLTYNGAATHIKQSVRGGRRSHAA